MIYTKVCYIQLCLGQSSITMKRCHECGNTYKRKHLVGTNKFIDLVHYHLGGKNGSTQAGMVSGR